MTLIQDFEHTSEGGCDDWIIIDETQPKPKVGHNPICRCYDENVARLIGNALNACSQDGFTIVPIEPTDEMIVAGGHIPWSVQDFWEIMLAAVPGTQPTD